MRSRKISAVLGAFILITVAASLAHAQFKVLYNFGKGGISDPCQPQNSGIIAQGRDGNLYTTTPGCGSNDEGAAFKVAPSGTFSLLATFGGVEPGAPFGGLTLGPDGNFYGTTQNGGTAGDGTIFKMSPSGGLSVLYSFAGFGDGYTANAPPIQGADGNFYGTARRGGDFVTCGNGCGTVYKVTPSGALIWSYKFDITHGLYPYAPLVQGTDGNFYGTTQEGGTSGGSGGGVVFKITPSGTLTVLHNFCSKPACADGQYPFGTLVQGRDGNFYGTTQLGGANNSGEVFRITPGGSLAVLHSLTAATDGANPTAGLVLASDGNFYGVTQLGGLNGAGTIFKITPAGTYSAPYNFDGTTGAQPEVTLVQHTNGILYGDTYVGGTASQVNCSAGMCGVFFSYNANLPQFITPLAFSGKVGSKIGILGQGFSSSSVVKFNGVQATTVTLSGATYLTATVPTGASDGYVSVTTGATTLKSVKKFIVHNSWGQGKAIPTPVAFASGAAANNLIYVLGGYSGSTYSSPVANNQVYNPSTNAWSTGDAMPSGLAQSAAAVVNNIVYVIGGTPDGATDSNAVWAYNPATNSWSAKASMPTARRSLAATVENGIIYAIAGFSSGGGRLKTVEAYNPATDTWTTKASMLEGKSEPTVGLIGTTIVSADGFNGTSQDGDNEGYNAATNSWSARKADPNPRDGACGGVIGSQLYVAGGFNSVAVSTVNDAFNLSTNSWTTLAPISHSTALAASAVYKSQLYCFGGWGTGNGGSPPISNVQVYQP